jgi:hypothetical protein
MCGCRKNASKKPKMSITVPKKEPKRVIKRIKHG